MFPRQNSGIDGIPYLSKIETISQIDMTGKDVSIELTRGNTFTNDLTNWGYRFDPTRSDNAPSACLPDLPSGFTYQTWHLTAVFDGYTYQWDFAMPADQTPYLRPTSLFSIVNEFFQTSGFYQVFVWDFAIQDEDTSTWQTINDFSVTYQYNFKRNIGSGVRVGYYEGSGVLEFSNDRTDTYAKLNDHLSIGTAIEPAIVGAPNVLSFAYIPGGALPTSQSFSFSASTVGLAVTSATSTTDGGSWLSAAISGNTLTASVNPAGLANGTYAGTVTLLVPATSAIANTAVVLVTLIVGSPTVTITGVSNAASGASGIQSGSWVSVYGANLSTTTRIWQPSDFSGNSLPTTLDGVTVAINGKKAAVYYISPGQLNVQAPTDATAGPVQLQVKNVYGSALSTATLQPYSPGFFTQGKYVAAVHTDGAYVAPAGFYGNAVVSRPAQPGETLLIYGTGFGPTTPTVPAGQIFSGAAPLTDPTQLHVTMGGAPAMVQFAGIVVPGEYQFNVVVPALPDGDQAIIATIGGLSTQSGLVIAIKN